MKMEGVSAIKEISEFPIIVNNNHESLYRCYHTLRLVLEMVNRGDSKETINQVADFLNNDH